MTATSIVAPLAGSSGEVRTLRALSERLANLHGLDVTFRANGPTFTVRFSRRPLATTGAAPRRGILSVILAAVSSAWTRGR